MGEMELESFVVTQQQQHQVAATEKPHHQPGTTLGEPFSMGASAMMALILALRSNHRWCGGVVLRSNHRWCGRGSLTMRACYMDERCGGAPGSTTPVIVILADRQS